MQYNLKFNSSKTSAFIKLGYFAEQGYIVELKRIEDTRTSKQNRALHLYFKHVANALLEIGYDYIYVNPIDGEIMHIPYTGDLVKNFIWRTIDDF